jgi:hypothetical protein
LTACGKSVTLEPELRKVKKFIFVAPFIALLTVFLNTDTPQVQAKHSTTVEKFQITSTSEQENAPIINKKLVVYRRHNASDVDVFGYDLKTEKELVLVQRPGHQSPVDLSDKYLLYTDDTLDPTIQQDVRLLNLRTKVDTLIAGGPGIQTAGAMWGNTVAYIEGYNCGELFIYNLHLKTRFDTGQIACQPIKMWSNMIVWSDWQNTGVYSYNILSKTYKVLVSSNGFYNTTPDIYGDTIVWTRYNNSNLYQIYQKNILTGKEKLVHESVTSGLSWPTISRSYIAWVDDEGLGAHDVFAQKRTTGDVVQLNNDGPQEPSPTIPDIWQNTVVWMSWVTGNGDIYGATLK